MNCIYTVNSNYSAAADGMIPVGTIVRRQGCGMNIDGGAISCSGRGYYKVTVCATITPTTAGPVGVRVFQDGAQVPGASSVGTGETTSPTSVCTCTMIRNDQRGMTMISIWLDSQGATTGSMIENMTVCVEESR